MPQDGDIWLHDKRIYYRISRISSRDCHIQKVVRRDGKWENENSNNPSYSLDNFQKSIWTLFEAAAAIAECPECNEEKQIPKDDFLCAECRAVMPVNCRLVADIRDDEVIVVISGTEDRLEILRDGSSLVSFKREDLPEVAIITLKKFLE